MASQAGFFEKTFKLSEHKTSLKTEIVAGLTTFMTMAYILAVNPNLLSAAGMPSGELFTATVLASVIGTLAMALLANYPFALAPGMGLNAYFAFTVCGNMGYPWQLALLAVFIEGVIFILLSFVNVREAIFNAIPQSLKYGISAGIGLFIAFIGLQNAGIVVAESSTKVTLGHITQAGPLLALIGLLIIAILYVRKVKGALLIGIIATYILGLIAEGIGWYQVDVEAGVYSLVPQGQFLGIFALPSGLGEIGGACFNFSAMGDINFLDLIVIVFAFLFVDMFDTIGTLIGVSSKADMLDKEGKLPKAKQALLADAIATTAGAVLGTSTTTTYVESASGVAEGGRTGLTAIIVAVLFLLSLFLSPLFLAIPSFATAPALIFVGFLMMESFLKVNFSEATEAIPAFIAAIMMPFAYSISEGIAFGVISYVIINLCGKKSKKVHPVMIVLSILFILYYIFVK